MNQNEKPAYNKCALVPNVITNENVPELDVLYEEGLQGIFTVLNSIARKINEVHAFKATYVLIHALCICL